MHSNGGETVGHRRQRRKSPEVISLLFLEFIIHFNFLNYVFYLANN